MNVTLYSSSTTSYNIKLADCGTIDVWDDGMGAGFSAISGTDPVIVKHTSNTYADAGVVLGDKLNMMQIGTADDPAYMFPDTGINRGAIFSDNTLTGYRNFSFGRTGPVYVCTSAVQVPLEWDPDTSNSSIYLAVAYLNGEPKIGFLGVDTRGITGTKDQCTFWYNETYSNFFLEYVDKDPGEKGFKPTGAYTDKNRPGIGGRGSEPSPTPRYKGDPLTQPGAPDESAASAVGSGFLTCYKIDQSNLDKVGKNLYGETLLDLLKNMAVNPMDFIVSLMVFPCAPAAVGSATNIKLGGWLCAASGGAVLNALGTDALANPLTKQFKVIDFGTVQIPENWGSFLDYQTSIDLYLPFIGTVTLDVSECMGGDINVQYTIDFFTGMCVANVLCRKPAFVLPSGQVIANVESQHSYQGNCAIQIPVSRVDYGSMIGSLINACTQGFRDPVGMLASIADGAVKPNVSSKGNIVANSGFCSVLYPYVRLTRPITAEPDSYQEVIGYPSYVNTTLGECEDLCVCDDIDLKGITGATDNEINRIRQMCKEGVYV